VFSADCRQSSGLHASGHQCKQGYLGASNFQVLDNQCGNFMTG
jgi:hypothetical protein